MSMTLQKQATQLVRAFMLKYKPENMEESRLIGIVYLGLKEGLNAVSIQHALPKMTASTVSALRACVSIVESASTQPSEQRTRRPADYVAAPPPEPSEREREAAQMAFAEMRQTLRAGEGTRTPRRPQERTGSETSGPPAAVPPPPEPGG